MQHFDHSCCSVDRSNAVYLHAVQLIFTRTAPHDCTIAYTNVGNFLLSLLPSQGGLLTLFLTLTLTLNQVTTLN